MRRNETEKQYKYIEIQTVLNVNYVELERKKIIFCCKKFKNKFIVQ